MALVLKADGPVVHVSPADGRTFTLAELQAAVDGCIELVRAPWTHGGSGEPVWLVLNEDGKHRGLTVNRLATEIYHRAGGLPDDVVVGDVVLGTHTEVGGA